MPSLSTKSCPDHTDQALLVTYVSAVMFIVGIFLPFVQMEPSLGNRTLEGVVSMISPDVRFSPQVHSLAGSLWSLFQHGDYGLGAVLLFFSILFPLGKLALLFHLCFTSSRKRSKSIHYLSFVGKWSMLDVLVIAILVISFKSFPGGTRIIPLWGVYVFATSITLSLVATMLLQAHSGLERSGVK